MKPIYATAILSAVFVLACNKEEASTPPESAAATEGGETAATGDTGDDAAAAEGGDEGGEAAEPKVWADMNFDERKMYMGTVVWPQMKEKFQAHDAEAFADFKCQTCHGDDMKEVKFEMPNALTPLPADDPMKAAMDMDEEVAKFMAEVVVPTMAEQLGAEPGPGEGQVGCFTCHLKE